MFKLDISSRINASRVYKLLATALLGTCSLLFITPSVAADQQASQRAQVAQENRLLAQSQTQALREEMANYRSASNANRENSLNKMVTLAEKRKELLLSLMESDQAAVASAILTEDDRQGMPDEVQALLEQKQSLDGELDVYYEDYEDHSKSRLRQVLKTATGRIELYIADHSNVKSIQSGVKVRAHGWKFDGSDESNSSLVLNSDQDSLATLADGSTATTTTSTSSASTLTNTLGEQRVLVMLINFQDDVQEPWTVEEANNMVFGTVNEFYKENSDNQTWLSGDVVGYYTLPISTTCDTWSIHTNAQQAAEDSGIDTSGYTRMVYILPENSSCGWTGKGTIGGSPSRAYINGSLSLRTVGHELGHNLGLYHAKDLDCGADVIGDTCASAEYGDALDIMGLSEITGHFNVFSKEQLGWLTSSGGEIVTVTTDGSYFLEPYETSRGGEAKGLKIRRGTDASTGQPTWYYVEYRQPTGFDSFIEGKSGITDGVIFHLATESDVESNLMLDMIPNSGLRDLDDAALLPGASYTDSDAGVTITTEWADSTGANVHISFTEATCIQATPSVSVLASQSEAVTAGSSLSYNVTVSNNDSNGCDASSYNVSATVPTGWSSTVATLSLSPGTSETVTLMVTSVDTANDGSYDITFNAVNNADSSTSSSSVASYLVEATSEVCVLSNPSVSLTANQSGEVFAGTTVSYTAIVTSNDSSNCDTATLDVIATAPDGWSASSSTVTLAPGQSVSVSLNMTSANDAEQGIYPVGAYIYNTADVAYNSSAESSYTVAAPESVCTESAPGLSVSSSNGDGTSGSTVTYSLTLTNQNSTDCEAKTYMVYAAVPTGWNTSSRSVSLASGQSATVQLEVTSSATASDGTYSIAVYAQDTADSSITSNAELSYVIINPANSAPVAVNDTVILSAKDAILIDVLTNDSDPDGDTLVINTVTEGSKGSVEITSSGQLMYTPAKSFKNSDSFSYTISDGDMTATATVSISLSSTTGSSGSNGKGKN